MASTPLTLDQILEMVPQQRPFRFVDELLEVNETGIVGRYTFRQDELFYAGHFPEDPITPGVILLETMCQTGVVALGLYLISLEAPLAEITKYKTLFTDAEVEFTGLVLPGDTVTVRAEKVFWRRRKLRSKIEMTLADGTIVASGTVSGIGVDRDS